MQACARIGAIHSVVFGGFSAKSLYERIEDAKAKMIITADEGMRGGKAVPLKRAVDEALAMGDTAVRRTRGGVSPHRRRGQLGARDLWWHELTQTQADTCEPVWVNAEHPLFILYTSGSTGKPKGVQHSTGGYLLGAILSMQWVFDAKPDSDVFWCTADVGWITGHTYVAYGPLALGMTEVIFEGIPTYPACRALLGDHPEAQGHHFLHRADRDPLPDQARRRSAGQYRPVLAAPAGHGGRADQSRSLDVVSRSHRRRPLPDRRYLVADRNRLQHDFAAARRGADQARLLHLAAARHHGRRSSTSTAHPVEKGHGGFLVIKRPFPSPVAHPVGRPRALQEDLFPRGAGRQDLSRRRLGAPRQRRLFLDHGPHRRCAECVRASFGHHGNRIRAGVQPARRRGRRGGQVRTRSRAKRWWRLWC